MTRRTVTEYIEVGFAGVTEEVEADIEVWLDPACRGARERGTGLQLEPDCLAHIEIISVVVSGVDWRDSLPDKVIAKLEAQILANEMEGTYA